jgi:hypothetical protein
LTTAASKKSEILNDARVQGFDAVLAVIAEPSVPDPALIGGVMLVRERELGADRIYPCVGIVMRVWRVSDGKQIGFTAPKPCGHDVKSLAWHDRWEEFSEGEKRATLNDLQGYVVQQMNEALVPLKLQDKK